MTLPDIKNFMSLDIFGNLKTSSRLINQEEVEDYSLNLSKPDDEVVDENLVKRPTLILSIFLTIAVTLLIGQLTRIQLISFPYYQNLSSGNSVKVALVAANRGLIVDRNLTPLAQNIYQHTVVVRLAELPSKSSERKVIYNQVKDLITLTSEEIKEIENIRLKDEGELILRENLDRDMMLLLKEKLASIRGFSIVEKPIRSYNTTVSLSHLLGYMSRVNDAEVETGHLPTEMVGRVGLEKVYETELKGLPGRKFVEVDATGKAIRTLSSEENLTPTAGLNLKLSLDLNLQKELTKYLQEAIDERNKRFGTDPQLGATAVVINPKTGAILSLASLPSYDNNLFATGISQADYQKLQTDKSLPMINRATQAQFPSGSVIKPVIAASSLDNGNISLSFRIDTPSVIQIGDFTFPDWKDHGLTDIRRAIAESNNIFFYGLGGGWENKIRGLGMEKMVDYFHRFGFGAKTGIDLPGEVTGFVPTPEWKKTKTGERWYIGDTYHFAIGQGDFLTTPLQLLNSVATIANNGQLIEPRLADAFLNQDNQEIKKVEIKIKRDNFISQDSLKVVREGMRQAVEYGSARKLNNIKIPIAGKTGTAQYGNQDRTHAWFISFAPYDNPELAIVVIVEGGGGGHESALPVAEKFYRYYYNDPLPEPKPELLQQNSPADSANPDTTPEPQLESPPANPDLGVPIEGE